MALRAEVARLIAARETPDTEATARIALQARSSCISPWHACVVLDMLHMHVLFVSLLPPSQPRCGVPDEVHFCWRMELELRTGPP